MIQPSLEEFLAQAKDGNLIPVWMELLADTETPVSVFMRLDPACLHAFLLESVERGEQLGRWSFIGMDPSIVFKVTGNSQEILSEDARLLPKQAPLDTIRALLQRYRPVASHPDLPPFTGGAVGYLGYDTVRWSERIPQTKPDHLSLPDCFLMFADTLVAFDHVRHRMILVANAHLEEYPTHEEAYEAAVEKVHALKARIRPPANDSVATGAMRIRPEDATTSEITFDDIVDETFESLKRGAITPRQIEFSLSKPGYAQATAFLREALKRYRAWEFDQKISSTKFGVRKVLDSDDQGVPVSRRHLAGLGLQVSSSMTEEEFLAAVAAAKEHIAAGDIFQVVLSQRFSTRVTCHPFDVYRALRAVNPSPWMFYLKCGEFQLAGSSPETLCKLSRGRAIVRPIAGTRPRGRTPAEDNALAGELLADAKERAEHVMLVDLGRNDVGRVSNYGTVTVDDFMIIERYSHVMHIVSNVSGELSMGKDALDALTATFPAGTLSGAPKIRAMEIIDELEASKRGPYGGAVVYLGFNGSMDSAITIRTVVISEGFAHVQAGAGVVADSIPEAEYMETIHKARGMLAAVEMAQQGLE